MVFQVPGALVCPPGSLQISALTCFGVVQVIGGGRDAAQLHAREAREFNPIEGSDCRFRCCSTSSPATRTRTPWLRR